jgi:multidrug efflux pump subunit AcrB
VRLVAFAALLACRSQPTAADHAAPPATHAHAAITVEARLPGATATELAASVSIPLERRLGQIATLQQMTSRSVRGATTIRLDFVAGIDPFEAAMLVQRAIDAAAAELPPTMPSPPTYRKLGRELPVLRVALSSDVVPLAELGTEADALLAQKLAQVSGVGLVSLCGAPRDEWRVRVDPERLAAAGKSLDDVLAELRAPSGSAAWAPGQLVRDVAKVEHGGAWPDCIAYDGAHRAVTVTVRPQALADRAQTLAGLEAVLPALRKQLAAGVAVRELPPEPVASYDVAVGTEEAPQRRLDEAGIIATALGSAYVELGVDLDGDASPETIAVHGVDRAAVARVAMANNLTVRELGTHVIGLSGPDTDALHDTLAQLVAALRKTSLPVYATIGDDRALATVFERDRAAMATLGVSADAVDRVLQAVQPEGIVATAAMPIVVTLDTADRDRIYVPTTTGQPVPLSALVTMRTAEQPSVVIHRGQFPWVGVRVGGTRAELDAALATIATPIGIVRDVD